MPTVIVLCPLQIEARSARRALGTSARIVRTGPGPVAVRRALAQLPDDPETSVILYGTAGGLSSAADRGAPIIACRAARVVDLTGTSWTPPAVPDADPPTTPGQVVLGVDAPVFRVTEKQDLAHRTKAAIVDCESHAFAPAAEARGWRWVVVRGVSDDERTELPREVAGWVSPDGRTATRRVVASMLKRPSLVGDVTRLARRTSRALRAAEVLLRAEARRLGAQP